MPDLGRVKRTTARCQPTVGFRGLHSAVRVRQNRGFRVPDVMACALQSHERRMRSIVAFFLVCLTSGCNALLGNGSGDVPASDDDAGSVVGTAGGGAGRGGAAG